MSIERPTYPSTRAEPVTESMGGVTFDDPYQWLEEDTPEVLAWEAEQTALAEKTLASWAGAPALIRALESYSRGLRVFAPVGRGGNWFSLHGQDAGPPALVVRSAPDGPHRVLLDPGLLAKDRGVPVTIDWIYPSPGGTLVACGLSERGSEQSVLHLVDVRNGNLLPERIPFAARTTVGWLPDASGFFYNAGEADESESIQQHVSFHAVGADVRDDEQHDLDMRGEWLMRPVVSRDGRYVAIFSGGYTPRPFYVRRLPDGDWAPFLLDAEGSYLGELVDDVFLALTTDRSPRGRVVAIPIASVADRSTWRDVVPESDACVRDMRVTKSRLVLVTLVDGGAELHVFGRDGTPEGRVPVPGAGAVSLPGPGADAPHLGTFNPRDDSVTFEYSAVDSSPSVYHYDAESATLSTLVEPAVRLRGVTTTRMSVVSTDGASVPVTLFHRGDVDLDGPRPTLIAAYGGFGLPWLPRYTPARACFVAAGGVLVIPGLRGGGERGHGWWMDGRRAKKQNTFDDLYAVAEHLIRSGWTSPEQLAVFGTSNGGLLAAVAAIQRPDLWQAAVSYVPLLDLFRVATKEALTAFMAANEYGDPNDPEQALWLAGYSPYQNVRDSMRYPAMLIAAADNDARCAPWHSRKLAARLQAATCGDAPILLRIRHGAGHAMGFPIADVQTEAEWLGFVMSRLGMEPPGAAT